MTAAAALLLAACASSPPQQQAVDAAPLRAFAARGYASVQQGAVRSAVQQWTLQGQSMRLLLLRPDSAPPGGVPLVVYLPGLGETPEAGAEWRSAWARAGYAVLSFQALAADAAAFQSDLAREGSFRALGLRHYGGDAMKQRLQALSAVLAEARRRGDGGEAQWRDIAWDRVAVAGFDLGAYTAMAMAGESVRGLASVAERAPALQAGQTGPGVQAGQAGQAVPAVRAVIALSPFVNVSEGGLDTRYAAIHAPVLSVTSDTDGDPLGLVGGAALRLAPFEHAAAPDQYLLSVQGLAHARLAGNSAPAPVAGDARNGRRGAGQRGEGAGSDGNGSEEGGNPGSGDDRTTRGSGGNDGSGGGNGGGRRRGGASGGGMGGGGGMVPRNRNGAAGPSGAMTATAAQLRLIAVQDVSTAFLDAYLRDDDLAREWLRVDAARWLGTAGELRRK